MITGKENAGLSIIQYLQENINTTESHMNDNNITKGDDDWYKHCGFIIHKLVTDEKMNKDELYEYLIEHMIDVLLFQDKLLLLNYLTQKKILSEMTKLELTAKKYMEKNILYADKLTGIILYDTTVKKIMILDENTNTWINAQAEDERDLANVIKKKYAVSPTAFNDLIGFIGYDQKNKYLVFKIKDMTVKRNTGARCDQATKAKSLVILNKIIGFEKWTKENTKKKNIVDTGLCIIEEFTLRQYNKQKKDGKIWFLDPDTAKVYKIGSLGL